MAGQPCSSGRPLQSPVAMAASTWSRRICMAHADSRWRSTCSGGAMPPPPSLSSIRRWATGSFDAVRSCSRWCKCGGSCVGIARRSRKVLAAAHGGTRVVNEGLDPHSHLRPVFVGDGGVGLTGPIFCRYGLARIRGLLDGGFRPHPLSHQNYKRYVCFEGPVRHALSLNSRDGLLNYYLAGL
jgi:hypothetical protein